MLNTASSFLALLRDTNVNMKSLAINKIESIVDEHWAEISDYIKELETIFSNNSIPSQKNQIALILSKCQDKK